MNYLVRRWGCSSGYREILILTLPLILTTSSWAIQQFIDRMFLSWHSQEAFAAAVPAGQLNFTLLCLFIGTAAYSGTFVAQYVGAKQYERIGVVLRHGIYLSFIGAFLGLLFLPFSDQMFQFFGHGEEIEAMESTYFKILCVGSLCPILSSVFGGFFMGQGRLWPVLWVQFLTTAVNLVLDYLLIFGVGSIPEMGIAGAAWATVIAGYISLLVYVFLIFTPKNCQKYGLFKGKMWDFVFFRRYLHFGIPSGIQFFLGNIGYLVFLLILGRIGADELAATNVVVNINGLVIMPIVGLGMAVTIIVGRCIGENNPRKAKYATYSAVHLGVLYTAILAVLLPVYSRFVVSFFALESSAVSDLAVILFHFVTFYCIFDAVNVVFASALKGAGDTRFIMWNSIVLSLFVWAIPTWFAVEVLKTDIFVPFFILSVYILLLSITHMGRFLQGKWQHMRVIEHHDGLPSQHPIDPFGTM